ncbi:unnamed protein product [Leuciscus chuanchicus]
MVARVPQFPSCPLTNRSGESQRHKMKIVARPLRDHELYLRNEKMTCNFWSLADCADFSRGTRPNRCEQHLFMVIALGRLPSKTWIFPDRSPLVRSLKLVLTRFSPLVDHYFRLLVPGDGS